MPCDRRRHLFVWRRRAGSSVLANALASFSCLNSFVVENFLFRKIGLLPPHKVGISPPHKSSNNPLAVKPESENDAACFFRWAYCDFHFA
jgi:hypothetical protein